jgi:hypothetical protein
VISSFAGGRMSYGMLEGLEKLKEKNIPIVIASSIQQGRIIGHPYQERGWIIAPDLPANKARVLLMLSLTKANNKEGDTGFFQQLLTRCQVFKCIFCAAVSGTKNTFKKLVLLPFTFYLLPNFSIKPTTNYEKKSNCSLDRIRKRRKRPSLRPEWRTE